MKYLLRCQECGLLEADRLQNQCPQAHEALLLSEYSEKKLEVRKLPGMWKFLGWLPCDDPLPHPAETLVYRGERLGRELGLRNLWISFNGYWPERGASLTSCSFKELEVAGVLSRTKKTEKALVVASAGNTGRAFAMLSRLVSFPIVVVIPRRQLETMWTIEEVSPRFLLLAAQGGYQEAIEWAGRISKLEGTVGEGGARNVGRRDGIGTILLDTVLRLERMPDHYFQAVGSGVGALAVWEASRRLLADGRFGGKVPKLHLSQNLPFAPMFNAWKEGRRNLRPERDLPDPSLELEVYARVLSNRSPPYSLRGGVYEALLETGGRMYGISNEEALEAQKLVEEVEGIDLDPAASVTVASLLKASEEGEVGKEELILLNLTGGGYARVREEHSLQQLRPALNLKKDTSLEEVREVLRGKMGEKDALCR